nr:Protein K02F3.9 [Haemonchus contortus]
MFQMWQSPVLVLLTMSACFAYPASGGLDVENLSAGGKKFFMDMTKQVMGVPSLKPENLAAQTFFRSFLDKYTKLDDNIKRDMEQHIPTATKIFNQAAKKYNIDPHQAFQILSTFFENFKKGASGNVAQQGLKMAGKLFGKKGN